jgi:hypothetical protein
MKSTALNWLVTLSGAITSLLTALLVFWIEKTSGYAISSWTFWFVIPVGALICGGVASSGYYLGAKALDHKPKFELLINMLVISVGTYFLIQYLQYSSMLVEGKKVSEMVSFWKFWTVVTTNLTLHSIELGRMGYLYTLLQIGGFSVGGLVVYAHLDSLIYCDKCSLYLRSKGKSSRTTNDPELLKVFISELAKLAEAGKLAQIIVLQASKDWGKELGDHFLMTEIDIQYCKKCAQHHFGFEVKKKVVKGKQISWEVLKDFSYSTFTDIPLAITQTKTS